MQESVTVQATFNWSYKRRKSDHLLEKMDNIILDVMDDMRNEQYVGMSRDQFWSLLSEFSKEP